MKKFITIILILILFALLLNIILFKNSVIAPNEHTTDTIVYNITYKDSIVYNIKELDTTIYRINLKIKEDEKNILNLNTDSTILLFYEYTRTE